MNDVGHKFEKLYSCYMCKIKHVGHVLEKLYTDVLWHECNMSVTLKIFEEQKYD